MQFLNVDLALTRSQLHSQISVKWYIFIQCLAKACILPMLKRLRWVCVLEQNAADVARLVVMPASQVMCPHTLSLTFVTRLASLGGGIFFSMGVCCKTPLAAHVQSALVHWVPSMLYRLLTARFDWSVPDP